MIGWSVSLWAGISDNFRTSIRLEFRSLGSPLAGSGHSCAICFRVNQALALSARRCVEGKKFHGIIGQSLSKMSATAGVPARFGLDFPE
jgi:hypothetical protein